jgi:ParB family chromosome partitioning protein
MLEVRYIELTELKPWKDNPRLNDRAVDAVAESIQRFGFNVPILCDQELTIVAGHVRWKAAKKLGMGSVPVLELQLSDAQRRAFSIADNKTGEIAEWDYPALADILKALESEKIGLLSLGFNNGELQALLEPQNDFDFSEFEDDQLSMPDLTHVSLAVKVPINLKGEMKRAIDRYAAEQRIAEKDSAVLAGTVFAALLEVTPWTSR